MASFDGGADAANNSSHAAIAAVRNTMKEREEMEKLNDNLEVYIRRTSALYSSHSTLVSLQASRRTSVVASTPTASPSKSNEERLRKEVKRQQAEIDRLQSLASQLEKQFENAVEVKDTALNQLEECAATQQDLRTELEKQKEAYDARLASTEATISSMTAELEESRARAHAAERRVIAAEAEVVTLKHQLNHQQSLHETTVTTLEEELQACTKAMASKQAPDTTIDAAVAEVKKEFQAAANAYRHKLRQYYATHARGPQAMSSSWFTEERMALKQQVFTLTKEKADLSTTNASLHATVDACKQEVAAIRQSMKDAVHHHTTEIKAKEERIAALTAHIRANEKKYADLLDERLWLDAEIDEYRRLLNSIQRPPRPKKKKATPTRLSLPAGTPAPRTQATTAPVESDKSDASSGGPGRLELRDVDTKVECLLVANPSKTSSVDIDGWALTASADNDLISTLEFSAHVLPPGGVLRVFQQRNEHFVENRDCLWDELTRPREWGDGQKGAGSDGEGL
ncbi:hypothetical protein PTSG_10008 [Salpingoeca rosetta]|uniref:IF rod domain-containing protein n=1 Tax=Salpingoeca rosetta (strain ATCC 50818 / BSB-021) TaxID=946362 RepID=F2UP89_SALR5|nr:uncharacterized protein PTSG_10008 [Salpingoeca rosetta]EGD79444.1 hypothetical protein PTSG_10008 [Salpingoeca rosetta]|eukprot:XP_004988925.1 hypothetical protein PTSG_10008 [Salpingoeca rosetta]